MSKSQGKRSKPRSPLRRQTTPRKAKRKAADLQGRYDEARTLAESGRHDEARRLYLELQATGQDSSLRALIANDLGALAALTGDLVSARAAFEEALRDDAACEPARQNLELLAAERIPDANPSAPPQMRLMAPTSSAGKAGVKVAILSFLFSYPSTGGGIVHTVELARFLALAGYDVQHFYVRYEPWGIGEVQSELGFTSEALAVAESEWNVAEIQRRFRSAVDRFQPGVVLITDTWNMKPHLAEAMRGYRTFLRFQALECVCPLNNVRLLVERDGSFSQCDGHQLRDPRRCQTCLAERGQHSGELHQAERALAGVGTDAYQAILERALRDAAGVLVLNPLTRDLLSPFSERVYVVPWGMDPARFPSPTESQPRGSGPKHKKTIFQAGLASEFMKGFHILHAACIRLWERRQDFRLVVTSDPAGTRDAFTEFTGWVSQEELPRHYRAADIVVVPTVAQEGLSRTSVEAMAAGKPVVASRIGGLPATVTDGETGLLFTPGDAEALAAHLERLLDDDALRERLGRAGAHALNAISRGQLSSSATTCRYSAIHTEHKATYLRTLSERPRRK